MKQHWKIGVIYIFICCFASIASDIETGRFCEPIKIPMCQNLGMKSCSFSFLSSLLLRVDSLSSMVERWNKTTKQKINIIWISDLITIQLHIQATIWQKCPIWSGMSFKRTLIWRSKRSRRSFNTGVRVSSTSSSAQPIYRCAPSKSTELFHLAESCARLLGWARDR